MLRKKLSKLIVGIMTAVMVTVGGSGVGQAVFANSNAGVVATQVAVVNVTDTKSMLEALINNPNVELKVNVTGTVDLSNDIVNAINARTSHLTIEVENNSVLTISGSVNLNGKDAAGNSKVTIVRDVAKKGAMLETRPQATTGGVTQVTITGVTFDNAGIDLPAFENKATNNIKVTLNGNTLSNGGDLSYTSANNNNAYINNILGTGSLTDNQNIELSINDVAGATIITISGTTTNYASSISAPTGEVKLKVTDVNGNNVGEKSKIPVDNAGSFSGEVISGLKPAQVYNVTGEAVYTDGNGNTYTRKSTSHQFTTINFSSSVTNIGNNSATININHGGLPNSVPYPLKITVSGGTATPSEISATTNLINVTGLASGTSYTYEIKSGTTLIDKGTFRTTSSTITGGGSTGGSVVSGDLTTNDINRADIKDVSVSIPVGNTTLANSLRDGKDYKTNIEGVSVTYSNGKVEFTGLVPEKDYRDLTITYTDKDGRTRTVKVASFKTKVSETKLRQFIVDVYRYSLDRVADERGFAYWEDQLSSKKTSPADFVKNLLNEPEFINKHKTTTAKIEGLYQVIVNRKSDSQGLSFWTKKYDDLVARGYSESMALRVIVDEMVNEQEFKNRVRDLGL